MMRYRMSLRSDWVAMGLFILFFTGWQLSRTGGLRWEFDEGAYLAATQLIYQGLPLYREVFGVQPPLFFYSLLWTFNFPDWIVPLSRMTIVGISTLGLIATGLLGQQIGGRWAGFITILLLAWHPRFFLNSKVIIGDVPSMALAVVALWLLWLYHAAPKPSEKTILNRTSALLLLASATFGLALGLKLLPIFLLPLCGLIILQRHYQTRNFTQPTNLFSPLPSVARDGLLFGAGVILTFAMVLLPFDVNAFIEQNLRFRLSGMSTEFRTIPSWQFFLLELLTVSLGYSMLALTGLIAVWQQHRAHALFGLAWLALTATALANYSPLWPHLLVVWVFPLSIFAAVGLKIMGEHVRSILRRRPRFSALNALAVMATVCFLILLPYHTWRNGKALQAPTFPTDLELVDYLTEHVDSDRYVITDEPILAAVSHKRLVPNLTDTSHVRLKSGLLTETEMISLTEQYQPQAIVFGADERFITHLPGYVAWVKANYHAYPLQHPGHQLFIEK